MRRYVRYYWVLDSREPFSILTFPIGCPQIIFHRRSPLFIPELSRSQDIFTISGQVNFPANIQSSGDLEMVVAVFYPHTIGMFIGTPPSEFYNLEISGYDLENKRLNELADMILSCDSIDSCIRHIDGWLLSNIRPKMNMDRIESAICRMLHSPSVSVNDLAYEACLCKKQFGRIFREMVGMNTKEYSRIVRFQKALWLMQQGDTDYIGIAACCGFSDQSHFIREFKALGGHTPAMISRYCTPYSDLYTNPV